MTNFKNYLKQHPEIFWLIAILALSTLLRLCFLHEPFERDEGQYASIAQEILRGGLPYRDAVEIKPPGTFYLYALAIGLFGATTEAVRIFTALYAMLTVVAVYAIARQVANVRAGLCAALVYGIFSTFPLVQGSSSNTEVFFVLPLTTGVWFLIRAIETKGRRYLFWGGLCAAFALLIKPVALPIVALEILFIPFIRSGSGRAKESALDVLAFLAPMPALALATFGYFALRGAFGDIYYWTLEFPRSYRASTVSGPPLPSVLGTVSSALVLPALLGIPMSVFFAWSTRRLPGLLIMLLIPAVVVAVALPGKYFPHYFITLIPFFAIPAGMALDRMSRLSRVPACLALLAVLALFGRSVQETYKFYTVYTPQEVSIYKYGITTFAQSGVVAGYLRERTRPDEYIFQWGFEPELYFLTDRRFPSRYLVSIIPGWSKDPKQAVAEMVRGLNDKKPAYIVFQDEFTDFDGAEEVAAYVDKNCRKDVVLEYAHIFRCTAK
jgi:4-amino-4-deoxy-L-arabinose transferase-like glycosyltransferase